MSDLAFEFNVTRIDPRRAGGTWVFGTILRFRFEALVFEEHAESEDFELKRSRISKLESQ